MNSILEILRTWSDNTDSRAKLQQAYLASALGLLLLAGMVGLINYNLGQQILLLALVAGSIFIINAVAWALLQSFILLHLETSRLSRQEPAEEEPKVKKPAKKTTKTTKVAKTTKK